MNTTREQNLLRVAFTSNATAQQSPRNSATSNATTAQLNAIKLPPLQDLARAKRRNKLATHAEKDTQLDAENKEVVVAHFEAETLVLLEND